MSSRAASSSCWSSPCWSWRSCSPSSSGRRCGCCRWPSRWAASAIAFGVLALTRRQPDDGLDRRAPGPDRALGRLRDPVPRPLHRGAAIGFLAAARRRRGGCRGRPGDRHRVPGDRRRLPRPLALADPDGPLLRPAARARDRDRLRPGADGGSRDPLDDRAAPARRRQERRCRRRSKPAQAAGASRRRRREALAPPRLGPGPRQRLRPSRRSRCRSPTRAACSPPVPCSPSSGGGSGRRPRSSPTSGSSSRATCPRCRTSTRCRRRPGVSGEVDVTVNSADLASPRGDRVDGGLPAARARRSAASIRARTRAATSDARICPSISLPDLFARPARRPRRGSSRRCSCCRPTSPRRWSRPNQETGEIGDTAVLAFGIKVMPLDEQKKLLDGMRDAIDPPGDGNGPPEGVDAEVVGLPVLAADANTSLSSNRYLLSAIGLLAVALALLAVYRSARRALVPLIPIVFATGWSALVRRAGRHPAEPDVGDAGGAGDRDRDRVQRPALRSLRGGARRRPLARRVAALRLLADRRGGDGLGGHRDRRLRRPDRLRHPHAARLRPRHRSRPRRRPRGRADRAAGSARLGRDRLLSVPGAGASAASAPPRRAARPRRDERGRRLRGVRGSAASPRATRCSSASPSSFSSAT